MNKDYILFNLREALEQLNDTIISLENNDGYGIEEYEVDIKHLYHHINTAWNAKKATEKQGTECSERNFLKWRNFPQDVDMTF